MSVNEFISILSEKAGLKEPKISLPRGFLKAVAPLLELYAKAAGTKPFLTRYSLRKLESNCNFSHKKAELELDYTPRPVKESLSDMVDWIKSNK